MPRPFSTAHADANTVLAAHAVIPHAAMEAAIDWMVLLRSGDCSDADHQRFAAWQSADVQHQCAWEKVAGVLAGSFVPLHQVGQAIPGHAKAAEQAMLQVAQSRHSPTRRKLLRGVLAAGAISVIGTSLVKNGAIATLADLHTGVGERRSFDLPDGSSALLNACAAADVDFSGKSRLLRLHQGELIVTARPNDDRPFIVQTDCGTACALQGRFLVRQDQERSFVVALDDTTTVATSNSKQNARVLRPGDAVWFNRQEIGITQAGQLGKAAWIDGMLSVNDEPLGDVITAIKAYRHGYIRVSAAASRLRVLGAFPLDDTDRLLASLVQTLPIQMTQYGPWLVLIDTA